MANLFAPPQDRKPKQKLKSIFEDDNLLIEKAREYLQLHQNWQNSKSAGDGQRFMFPTEIAEKLKISIEDATELKEFAHSPEYGEFERDHIFNTPHISVDYNGNEIQKCVHSFQLVGVGQRLPQRQNIRIAHNRVPTAT